MSPQQLWTVVLAALIGGIVGGGAIAAIGYRALKDKLIGDLKEVFAKKSDLNNWGSRVNALETVAIQARDQADTNSDAIIRLQESDKLRWEPVLRLVEKLDQRLNGHEQAITRATAVLEQISQRLDRAEIRPK